MTSPVTLSPSVISAWLACEHSLTLKAAGSKGKEDVGPFADLVMEKGQSRETAVRKRYVDDGLVVVDAPEKGDQSFEHWASACQSILGETNADVVYQLPLVFDEIKGVADFVVRVEAEEGYFPGVATAI